MTRINTNVSSLTAQNRLQRTNGDLQTSLTRLSTGLRINSGKDDPAGLIASESLRSDITSINKALTNTQRANQIIGTADSALGQVSSLLNDIRGLVTEAANKGGLSEDEIAANQLQIDSSLEAINRIAQTTTFQGRRLLDGSLDFQVQQGTGFGSVKDLQIDSANLGSAGSISVNVQISAAATKALVTADIPTPAAAAKATATFTFNDTTIGAEAAGKVTFANSKVKTTESSAAIEFVAAAAANEASGTLRLDSGASLTIAARDGSVVDGLTGNNVKINVSTVASGTATTASYDAASNTLNLNLETGKSSADVVTALTASTAVNKLFSFGAGAGTISTGDAGLQSSVLTSGSDLATGAAVVQAAGTGIQLGAAGLKFDIAVDASIPGSLGNQTKILYTYGTTASAAKFDSLSNTIELNIDTTTTAEANFTAFNTALTGKFTLTDSTSPVLTGLTGSASVTGAIKGGLDIAGFRLTAIDGGLADGAKGDLTTLNYTSSGTRNTTAAYDASNNKLNISLGQGATIDDIANAIASTKVFSVADVKQGSSKYTGLQGSVAFTGGLDVVSPSSFDIKAVDGGLADGTYGNSSKVKFEAATGSASTAAYDEATNVLTVRVATGATTQQIADAITAGAGSVFQVTPGSLVNGDAVLQAGDVTGASISLLNLGGGTTNASGSKDELLISASANGSLANGVSVSFEEDSAVTAGAPTAAFVGNNILIKVSKTGDTKLSDIAAAINGLSGGKYAASLKFGSNGDGVYKGALETEPTTRSLIGGETGGGLAADLTFQLTGGGGSEVFRFEKGASIENIVQSINLIKDATGVSAVINAGKIDFQSIDYGSKGVVGIEVLKEGIGGKFATGLIGGPRAVGADVKATINGTIATGKGNQLLLNTSTLSLNLTLSEGSSTSVSFNINGGGAQFQLGPDVVSNQQARLGISSLNTAKIGGSSGKLFELASSGSSSLIRDVTNASSIVDEVINKVTTLRGRLGAFQRTALESNTNSLNDTIANLNEAQSSIRDADFAKESANLTRAQILIQSGTSVLGIANQSSQSVLSLLR